MYATYGLPVAVIGGGPVVAGSSRASSVPRPAGKPQPTGLLHPGLSTDRSPSPPLDMTTTVTGLLCWQDFHLLRWQQLRCTGPADGGQDASPLHKFAPSAHQSTMGALDTYQMVADYRPRGYAAMG